MLLRAGLLTKSKQMAPGVDPSALLGMTMKVNKSKVLVIDDEESIRRFLSAGLPEWQFELRSAGTAREGLQTLKAWTPDVLLLDLGLPDQDGLEVTKQVRTWSSLPIIILSVRGQESDKVAA